MEEVNYHPIPRRTDAPSGKVTQGDNVTRETGRRPEKVAFPEKDIPTMAVICFECGHISLVPEAALSARCHHCSAYINLDDIVIHNRSYRGSVRTRGNVTVREGTNLDGVSVQSHDLILEGRISENIECTGTCTIKTDQHINGKVHVGTLVIDRKVNAVFSQPVEAKEVEILGTFTGILNCRGTVRIAKGGELIGDLKATRRVLEDGSNHVGHFSVYPLS